MNETRITMKKKTDASVSGELTSQTISKLWNDKQKLRKLRHFWPSSTSSPTGQADYCYILSSRKKENKLTAFSCDFAQSKTTPQTSVPLATDRQDYNVQKQNIYWYDPLMLSYYMQDTLLEEGCISNAGSKTAYSACSAPAEGKKKPSRLGSCTPRSQTWLDAHPP